MITKFRLSIDVSINKPIEELNEQEFMDLAKEISNMIENQDKIKGLKVENNTGFAELIQPEIIFGGTPMYGPINPDYKPNKGGWL